MPLFMLSILTIVDIGLYSRMMPILTIIPLIVSDIKTRRIKVRELFFYGIMALIAGWFDGGWHDVLRNIAGNICTLIFLGILITSYLYLRRLPVLQSVGCGDIFFLLTSSPLFTPMDFIRFLIIACFISLVWWFCLTHHRRVTVPFVGTAGITLIGVQCFNWIRIWLQ